MTRKEFIEKIMNIVECGTSVRMLINFGTVHVYLEFIPDDFELYGKYMMTLLCGNDRISFDISEITEEADGYACGPDDNTVFISF